MAKPIFALPVSTWSSGQVPAVSSHQRSTSRKRKRGRSANDEHNDVPDSDEDAAIPSSSQTTQRSTGAGRRPPILTPDDIHQYSVAGQSLDQDLPGHSFPHSSGLKQTKFSLDERVDHTRQKGGVTAKTTTLRQQHLAVITAILHRCILKRDFERASRALGLILRDEIGGHTVDIRTHGRWGIGAEILVWRGQPTPENQSDSTSSPLIPRSGFEMARRYYERLIVQYPFHPAAKDSFDERDFHLALMGLWIYVAHQEGKMIREGPPEADEDGEGNFEAGTQRELLEARSIAKKLDGLMISPLYSSHKEFIRLRAMVALWIADLARDIDMFDGDPGLERHSSEVRTSLADSLSGVNLDDPGGFDRDDEFSRTRTQSIRNIEAEESQRKAEDLLAMLRHRLDDGLHD